MKRIIAIWAPVLMVLAAAWFGYSHYKATPVGDLLYTPAPGICPNHSHSFTTGYTLALSFAGVIWLVALVGSWVVGRLAKSTRIRTVSRSLTTSILLGVAILGVFWLLHPVAEHFLPLQPSPCTQQGP